MAYAAWASLSGLRNEPEATLIFYGPSLAFPFRN